ncbi:ADAM10 [Branchiostoma lanceolatum]|uniref:ADAM10 endopeptidase n=1 Tax=Branchiostoma lanceolatum TaxID=7740 RepID=A0A8J9ZDQ3_BRALA|nr:ADAM10 [Branchiostoma lanceolatum]
MAKLWLIALVSAAWSTLFTQGEQLNEFVTHFEGLQYDTSRLHAKHERARRAVLPEESRVHLAFYAHGRNFHLQMTRDNSMFSRDFQLETTGGVKQMDLSHIYSGHVVGEPKSVCHGSIIAGRFEGFIYTPKDDYYIELAERYFNSTRDFHSVMYKAQDVIDPPNGRKARCGVHEDHFVVEPQDSSEEDEDDADLVHEKKKYAPPHQRHRRAPSDKNTCPIFIMADHKFFEKYGTWEATVAQIAAHVKTANLIYRPLELDGRAGYGITVSRLKINTTADKVYPDNPFREDFIGAEAYLDHISNINHNDYCLAYGFTDRDFDGTLGIAWTGAICSSYLSYGGTFQSRNTGLVTVQLYGSHIPTKVSHITFAHELGHSWGSPHDSPGCSPGGFDGNYIMFAQATSGDRPNNSKMSHCSVNRMSLTVAARAPRCFEAQQATLCGNGIVEEGEECDCGFQDACDRIGDRCCNAATPGVPGVGCTRKQGATCSPSEGPCCNSETCSYRSASEICAKETECALSARCSGFSADCPKPGNKSGSCAQGSLTCLGGECVGSICEFDNMDSCQCTLKADGSNAKDLCQVCCQQRGQSGSCKPYPVRTILKPVGSPCNNNQGYCDALMKCREVDIDGPLARIKRLLLTDEGTEWVKNNWWVLLLGILAAIGVVVGVIYCLNAIVPSSIEQARKKARIANLRIHTS